MNLRIGLLASGMLVLGLLLGMFAMPSHEHDMGHDMGHDMEGSAETGGSGEPLYWVAPMDPNYRRDAPGKSPMGMDLIPVYEDGASDSGVRVSAEVQHNFGVRTERAVRAPLGAVVRSVGSVMIAETLVEHVHTRTSGWIERLAANVEGDPVARGDVLYELYSPELVRAQEEFLLATDGALRSASRDRLRALGMSPQQIDALAERGVVRETTERRAARGGFVMDLAVREGVFVEPASAASLAGLINSGVSFGVQLLFPWELATLGAARTRQAAITTQARGARFEGVIALLPGWRATARAIARRSSAS